MAPLPPSKPSARTLRHQRVTGQIHPLLPPKIFRDGASTTDSFLTSKADRRLMKHSAFLSKVQSSATTTPSSTHSTPSQPSSSSAAAAPNQPGAGILKPSSTRRRKTTALSKRASTTSGISKPGRNTKVRRPSKKLKTTLAGLADALPELVDEGGAQELEGRVKHRSLKGGKGALKRKENVVRGEMERFGASMAKLAGMPQQQQQQQQGDSVMSGGGQGTAVPGGGAGEGSSTSGRWAALRGYISSTMEQNQAFVNKS